MFFFLSKLLLFLLMPVLWVLVALGLALLARTPRRRLLWLRAGLGLLIVLSNPMLGNQSWIAWEMPPVPIRQVGRYDVAIVLTGITEMDKLPRDRVYLSHGADRVLHTVQLWRRGCFSRIIVTGGSGSMLTRDRLSEAGQMRYLLMLCGVPSEAIIIEEQSRNTRENALHTAAILRQHPQWQKRLLITSAFHMRRAEGCFRRIGLPVDTFPVDYYSSIQHYDPLNMLLPTENALYNWNRLVHEIAGYLTYKLVGYC